MHKTHSLCPVCKAVLPATIIVSDTVTISRICPEHGGFTGKLEKSPAWFKFCKELKHNKIYNGLMVDITGQCNIKCRYCYHNNDRLHISKENVLAMMTANLDKVPFFLTGGEPTLHPDLKEIISSSPCEVWVLTNGVKLSDPDYFDEIAPLLDYDGILTIGLSMHKESKGNDFALLELARERHKKIGTVFFVIDDLEQIDYCLKVYEHYKDAICSIRIKAASNLGAENGASNKIFVSEMVDVLVSKGFSFDERYSNKLQYASMVKDEFIVKAISWADISNIDLDEINCPPWYIAKDGNVYDLVTKCIMEQ